MQSDLCLSLAFVCLYRVRCRVHLYWKADRHLLRLCALGTRRYRPSCVRRNDTLPHLEWAGCWRWRVTRSGRLTRCTGWFCRWSLAPRARRPASRWWRGAGLLWLHTWGRKARRGSPPARWRKTQYEEYHLRGDREMTNREGHKDRVVRRSDSMFNNLDLDLLMPLPLSIFFFYATFKAKWFCIFVQWQTAPWCPIYAPIIDICNGKQFMHQYSDKEHKNQQ